MEVSREVGTRLLLENDAVRVCELALAPGEQPPMHRHATSYTTVELLR